MYTPTTIKPRRDWALVLHEKRKDTMKSGIIIPVETGVEKVREGVGRIIRLGPGDKNIHTGIKEGDRVVFRTFLQYANPIETDELWEDGSKKTYFLMSTDDIMMVVDNDCDVGVFSETK